VLAAEIGVGVDYRLFPVGGVRASCNEVDQGSEFLRPVSGFEHPHQVAGVCDHASRSVQQQVSRGRPRSALVSRRPSKRSNRIQHNRSMARATALRNDPAADSMGAMIDDDDGSTR
jgi:hypothetical protein